VVTFNPGNVKFGLRADHDFFSKDKIIGTLFGGSPKPDCPPQHAFGTLGKPSISWCALRWFYNIWTYGARVF